MIFMPRAEAQKRSTTQTWEELRPDQRALIEAIMKAQEEWLTAPREICGELQDGA